LTVDGLVRSLGVKLLLAALSGLAAQVVSCNPLVALGIGLGLIALAIVLERTVGARWAVRLAAWA
jgi:hypothetical protein